MSKGSSLCDFLKAIYKLEIGDCYLDYSTRYIWVMADRIWRETTDETSNMA